MFNSDFYPTPKALIEKMVKPYSSILQDYKTTILEPSAGKGDILDYIYDTYPIRQLHRLHVIEKDINLQHILRGKNYKLIDSDFLTYSSKRLFDLIVMNPPFSNGDDHLLKAWEVMQNGHIVCLLNKETITNPYSKKRKLLGSIIEQFGSVEYVGAAFEDAERTTNVEVALVRLEKKTEVDSISFEGLKKETFKPLDLESDSLESQIAVNDQIGNAIIAYKNLQESFETMAKAAAKVQFYASAFDGEKGYTLSNIFKTLGERNDSIGHNKVYSIINQEAWKYIFNSLRSIQHRFTSNVQNDFQSFQREQGEMEFSKENINSVLEMLMLNRDNLMKRSIVETFDYFTKYHSENRVHIEGWKTNSHYKVNQKVILPYIMKKDWSNELKIDYSSNDKLDDIDKALCFINADQFNRIDTIKSAIENRLNLNKNYSSNGVQNQTESTYFKIRFFLKGTVHLTFKDKFIWEQFNKVAVEGKEWLPNAY